MKQKYSLIRDPEKNTLIIKEYAELDKEILSLLCEESYTDEGVQAALPQGEQGLIAMIRTHNLYPPGFYSQKIAAAITEMYSENGNPSVELFFDDRELFADNSQDTVSVDEEEESDSEEPSVEVDNLLEEDDLKDDFDEDTNIVNNLKSSLKVSDDDSSDSTT